VFLLCNIFNTLIQQNNNDNAQNGRTVVTEFVANEVGLVFCYIMLCGIRLHSH